MKTWNILYRGPLSSCNYECAYCPFAKTSNTRAELQADERALDRFVGWVAAPSGRAGDTSQSATGNRPSVISIGLLFTPWGEALVHAYYRRALTALSHLPHVHRVAIQTNLSAPLQDFAGANRHTLALWTTYHPSETTLTRFLGRCRELDALGIRYSVGVVGLREHFPAIAELRQQLRPEIYLWINAYKRQANYYRPGDIRQLSAVDPYFHWNLPAYASAGKPCHAGETTFTVDGAGAVRRCHFIQAVIGNIYAPDFAQCLQARPCATATCACHIGYIHRPELNQAALYGAGLLERIPARWPEMDPTFGSSCGASPPFIH